MKNNTLGGKAKQLQRSTLEAKCAEIAQWT